ncbi:MAG: hypothetical protein FWF45_08105 [Coriobacteriia bacterium]|nr:hypothetical protein [Coriobacteriia bacterium]
MKTKRPAKTTIPSSIPAAIAGAAVTFVVSLPLMWLIGYVAITFYGLGIWIIPYLGSTIGLHVFASQGAQAYHKAVIIFAVIAALQNAALIFWNQRESGASKLRGIILRVLIGLTVLGTFAGLLMLFAL